MGEGDDSLNLCFREGEGEERLGTVKNVYASKKLTKLYFLSKVLSKRLKFSSLRKKKQKNSYFSECRFNQCMY